MGKTHEEVVNTWITYLIEQLVPRTTEPPSERIRLNICCYHKVFLGVGFPEPGVVGYRMENYQDFLTIVKVKAKRADLVYLASPKGITEEVGESSLYKDFGIGVFSVDGDKVEERARLGSILSMAKTATEGEVIGGESGDGV
jgi:hypothetical protein